MRSARRRTPYFARRLETWNFAVRSDMFSLLAISLLERFSRSASSTSRLPAREAGRAGRPAGSADCADRFVDEPGQERPGHPETAGGHLLDRPSELLVGVGERHEALRAQPQERKGAALVELLRHQDHPCRPGGGRARRSPAPRSWGGAVTLEHEDRGPGHRQPRRVRHQIRLEAPRMDREGKIGEEAFEFRQHQRVESEEAHRRPAWGASLNH